MSSFRLQIVTPDGSLFDGEAEALRVPTSEGYVSIRAGHSDYLASLEIGMATITKDGKATNAACGGGFLSVEHSVVRVVASTFEYARTIDVKRAEMAMKAAEARLEAAKENKDIRIANAKLARALNRISVAENK